MKDFFKKNLFQIIIGILGLVGMAYVLNANVKNLIDDDKQFKADIADLKIFKAVQEKTNSDMSEKVNRIDVNVEWLRRHYQ